jgi:hypothetical protein
MKLHIFLFFSQIVIIYSSNLRINSDRSCSSGSLKSSSRSDPNGIKSDLQQIPGGLAPEAETLNLEASKRLQRIPEVNLVNQISEQALQGSSVINNKKIEETSNLRGTVLEQFSNFGESRQNNVDSSVRFADPLYLPLKCMLPQHIKVNYCLAPSYFDENNITPNRLNYHIYYENYYSKLNWLERESFNKNCTNYSNIDLNEKSLEYYRTNKSYDDEPNILFIAIIAYFIGQIILSNVEAFILTFIVFIALFSNIKK